MHFFNKDQLPITTTFVLYIRVQFKQSIDFKSLLKLLYMYVYNRGHLQDLS